MPEALQREVKSFIRFIRQDLKDDVVVGFGCRNSKLVGKYNDAGEKGFKDAMKMARVAETPEDLHFEFKILGHPEIDYAGGLSGSIELRGNGGGNFPWQVNCIKRNCLQLGLVKESALKNH